jgi:hypothetical protein
VSKFSVNIEPKNDGSGLFRVTLNKAAADKFGGVGTRCSVRGLGPTRSCRVGSPSMHSSKIPRAKN